MAEVASPLARDDISPSGITLMREGSAPTRRKVKASMMHHSRSMNVLPASTTMRWHPAMYSGSSARLRSVLLSCATHAASSHSIGGAPCSASYRAAHACIAAHLASRASCHEWLTKTE